jgi:hypothetical protein
MFFLMTAQIYPAAVASFWNIQLVQEQFCSRDQIPATDLLPTCALDLLVSCLNYKMQKTTN